MVFSIYCDCEQVAVINAINIKDACDKWCKLVNGTEVHYSEGLVYNDYRVWLIKEGVQYEQSKEVSRFSRTCRYA